MRIFLSFFLFLSCILFSQTESDSVWRASLVKNIVQVENKIEHFTYPIFKDDIYNKSIKKYINTLKTIKKDCSDKSQCEVVTYYSLSGYKHKYLSIRFDQYQYVSFAAHPYSCSMFFNYNLEKKKELNISELFSVKEFLSKLSEICTANIKDNFGYNDNDEFWLEGAAPKFENFKHFYITDSSLVIYFQPYQVACYAAASAGYEVEIPFTEIEGILKL